MSLDKTTDEKNVGTGMASVATNTLSLSLQCYTEHKATSKSLGHTDIYVASK